MLSFKTDMNDNKSDSHIKISKKPFCLSFKKLDNYFNSPDLKIKNLHAVSARQFTADLDSVINFSKNKPGSYGRVDKISIDYDAMAKKNQHPLTAPVQKRERFKWRKILSKLLKYIIPASSKTVEIRSWTFKNFDAAKKFQVGKCYTLRPVSITYNSTQQDYKYNKQIISEFYIEEASGNIKKLVIIDNIKKGVIRREKYIDGQKINRQHYNLEIRNHRLNRGLMKTFLFHQIYKLSEYDQDNSLFHNKFDSSSIAEHCILDVSAKAKKTVFPTPKATGVIPEEYIRIPAGKMAGQNKEKMGEPDIQNRYDNEILAKDHEKFHGIFEMKSNSVYAADGYIDSKPGDGLISRAN